MLAKTFSQDHAEREILIYPKYHWVNEIYDLLGKSAQAQNALSLYLKLSNTERL